ncbi:type II toxin-antitoxin system RelE/ParE family toxin [Pseudomonas ovata]|uniref:type II toxin-antitoxin system RelE/ParE family toxin n=1 Tax=Pseudomonas ovata TaxID=1839709 RepID=UPI000D68875E|nr:type II toxin-antitoxin system RelE/ParE family toxin [Pseudomonas ovata]
MRVEWLKTALENLDDEAAWIARHNRQVAMNFVKAVQQSAGQLALFPEMGRQGRVAGTREWTIPDYPYLMPYRVHEGRLQILRLFHTRRSPPSDW